VNGKVRVKVKFTKSWCLCSSAFVQHYSLDMMKITAKLRLLLE